MLLLYLWGLNIFGVSRKQAQKLVRPMAWVGFDFIGLDWLNLLNWLVWLDLLDWKTLVRTMACVQTLVELIDCLDWFDLI